jgi:hypothetical protein
MTHSLLLYDRPARSDAFLENVTDLMPEWRHASRALGGYWTARGVVNDAEETKLIDAFQTWLGFRIVEKTYGITSWEGMITDMRLLLNGIEYRRTLNSDWWHNRVKVFYQYPDAEDTEQGSLAYDPGGNVAFQDDGQDFSDWETALGSSSDTNQGSLAYEPGDVEDSFQDDGQDFSAWETTSGDSAYLIKVTNDDGSTAWGFLGAAFTTTNSNDSVYVYRDIKRNRSGFNGSTGTPASYVVRPVVEAAYRIRVVNSDDTEAWGFLCAAFTTTNSNDSVYVYKEAYMMTEEWSGYTSGKTPSSYEVSDVDLAGSRQTVAWESDSDSEGEYGRMEYLVKLGGTTPDAATKIQDEHLSEFAWPRSRMSGSVTMGHGEDPPKNRMVIHCTGFFETMNWRYRSTSWIATASEIISDLTGRSEFVSVGRVDDNDLATKIDCDPIPQRLGDLLQTVTEQGDMDGNLWQCGVYADRELVYEEAPNTVEYRLRDGRLYDKGNTLVIPSLLEPGFLLRNSNAPSGIQPPGTSNVWDDPQVAYVDEVVFEAPDRLKLKLFGEEESVLTLTEQIRRGVSRAEELRMGA